MRRRGRAVANTGGWEVDGSGGFLSPSGSVIPSGVFENIASVSFAQAAWSRRYVEWRRGRAVVRTGGWRGSFLAPSGSVISSGVFEKIAGISFAQAAWSKRSVKWHRRHAVVPLYPSVVIVPSCRVAVPSPHVWCRGVGEVAGRVGSRGRSGCGGCGIAKENNQRMHPLSSSHLLRPQFWQLLRISGSPFAIPPALYPGLLS